MKKELHSKSPELREVLVSLATLGESQRIPFIRELLNLTVDWRELPRDKFWDKYFDLDKKEPCSYLESNIPANLSAGKELLSYGAGFYIPGNT